MGGVFRFIVYFILSVNIGSTTSLGKSNLNPVLGSDLLGLIGHFKECTTQHTLLITPDTFPITPWTALEDNPKLIPGKNSTSMRKGFPRIVLMLTDISDIVEESKALLKTVSNRKKDYFIFISDNRETLKYVFSISHIQRIQNKVGVYNIPGEKLEGSSISYIIEDPLGDEQLREISILSTLPSPRPTLGHNLNGRHLRCSGALVGSYIFATDMPNRFGEKLDGTHYRVVSEASETLNYTFESYAPLQSYGTLLENGTWIGLLSDVLYEDRNYDIGYNLAHVLIWNEHVDYAATLSQGRVTFVTRHPQSLALRMKAFLSPFQLSVWIAGMVSFVSVWFSLYCSLQFIHSGKTPKQNWYVSFILPYSILMEQGVTLPKVTRVKLISSLWLWCIMILGTGYKSNLVSYLSIPLKETIPQDMDELSLREDYTVSLNVIGVVEKLFFKQTELKRAKDIGRRLKFEDDTKKCVRRALENPYKEACLGWDQAIFVTTSSSFTLESRIPPLFESADGLSSVYLTLGIRKDSKYLDGIKSISYAFLESGITQKWQEEVSLIFKQQGIQAMKKEKDNNSRAYKIVRRHVEEQGGSSIKPFKIDNLFVCFVILAIGMSFSFIVLVGERILFHSVNFVVCLERR